MANRYDEVPYPGRVFPATHPDHLAVIATLFGMTPAPPSHCRVLELGCGDGGNLIPMAYELPHSEFTGVDLASRPIHQGREDIGRLGLRNIELIEADLADFVPRNGPFDYIIAHGLYSWVPADVREKTWQIIATHLTSQGVAYVSYNACPGGLFRDAVRQILLYHVRDIATPAEQISEARKLLAYLAGLSSHDDEFRALLSRESRDLNSRSASAVYHDYLSPESQPFWLHEVAASAAAHGLQYLGDADLQLMQMPAIPAPAPGWPRFPGPDADFLTREQYADIVLCRRFRRTLLCRAEVNLDRSLPPDSVRRFELASPLAPPAPEPSLDETVRVEFSAAQTGSITTNYPLGKAALLELGVLWPASIPFEGLYEKASRRLGEELSEESRSDLEKFLWRLASAGIVELHLHHFSFSASAGDRPVASPVARLWAERDALAPNLRHRAIELATPRAKQLLLLLDGTRDRATLAAEMGASPDEIEHGLRDLARMAMLLY